ncbi:hypothetical protein DENSPDRAFT_671687 [Dentipellis sp. KUC8613]|nr:hypothetical protein DENSPDRAFT_671687 [Dentipellis sp. KUC8613]
MIECSTDIGSYHNATWAHVGGRAVTRVMRERAGVGALRRIDTSAIVYRASSIAHRLVYRERQNKRRRGAAGYAHSIRVSVCLNLRLWLSLYLWLWLREVEVVSRDRSRTAKSKRDADADTDAMTSPRIDLVPVSPYACACLPPPPSHIQHPASVSSIPAEPKPPPHSPLPHLLLLPAPAQLGDPAMRALAPTED